MKFKVGDTVRIKKPSTERSSDKCYWVGGMDNFDGTVAVLKGKTSGKYWNLEGDKENWSFSEEWLEGIYEKGGVEEVPDKLIIHCPTQEDYNKIVDKIGGYLGGTSVWQDEETGLRIKDGKIVDHSSMDYHIKSYPDYTVTTAKEYLGEQDLPDKLVLDTSMLNGCGVTEMMREIYPVRELPFYTMWRESSQTLSNKPNSDSVAKTIMTNIVKFATDLTLSADEKSLRKAGLKNEDGYTSDAIDIVKNMEAKSLGFKDYDTLNSQMDNAGNGTSAFEKFTLVKKYEKELLAIATKYNKENKANGNS